MKRELKVFRQDLILAKGSYVSDAVPMKRELKDVAHCTINGVEDSFRRCPYEEGTERITLVDNCKVWRCFRRCPYEEGTESLSNP